MISQKEIKSRNFRAESIIQQQIHGFKPRELEMRIFVRGGQLPQPTEMNSQIGVSGVLKNLESASHEPLSPQLEKEMSSNSPIQVGLSGIGLGGGEWYPPVSRTVYVLNKLYRCVPVIQIYLGPLFSGFSHRFGPRLSILYS